MGDKDAEPEATLAITPRIHEAELGSLGRVVQGAEIGEVDAIARRSAGFDIVICGNDLRANRRLAQRIENAAGSNKHQDPHRRAGRYALPHYQPEPRVRSGHSFYETRHRKAAKNP